MSSAFAVDLTFTTRTTSNGLGDNIVRGVYAVGSTVYAATGNGLSISTNGGTTFTTKTTSNGLGYNSLWSVYAVGSTIYAGTNSGGLSISLDGGTTFTTKTTSNGLGSNDVLGVYAVGSTIYAATYSGGLSISLDGGTSWNNYTTVQGLGSNIVRGVYAVGSTIYAATDGGLSISTNGGLYWTNYTAGLGSPDVRGVYAVGSTIYAATGGGVSVSTDGGITWNNYTTGQGLGSNNVRGVYAVGSTVYAATAAGVSISTNGGTNWTSYTTGTGGNNVTGVSASGNTIYAAKSLADMFSGGGVSIAQASSPTVTSVSPSSGLNTGGTPVTITGSGFVSGATVSVGGVTCTSPVFVSATSLTCTTGAHAAGVVDIVVTNPDSGSGTGSGLFTYSVALTVSSVVTSSTTANVVVAPQGAITKDSSFTVTGGGTAGTPVDGTGGNAGKVLIPVTGLTANTAYTFTVQVTAGGVSYAGTATPVTTGGGSDSGGGGGSSGGGGGGSASAAETTVPAASSPKPPATPEQTGPKLPDQILAGNPVKPIVVASGITVIGEAEAKLVAQRFISKPASQTLSGAARVPVIAGKGVSLVLPGVTPGATVKVQIRVNGKYVTLGGSAADGNGQVALPVFKLGKQGTYTIAVSDTVTGRVTYLKIKVSSAP